MEHVLYEYTLVYRPTGFLMELNSKDAILLRTAHRIAIYKYAHLRLY